MRKLATTYKERRYVKEAADDLSIILRQHDIGIDQVRTVINDEFGDVEVRISLNETRARGDDSIDVYEIEEFAAECGFEKGSATIFNEEIMGGTDTYLSMTFFYTYPEVQ